MAVNLFALSIPLLLTVGIIVLWFAFVAIQKRTVLRARHAPVKAREYLRGVVAGCISGGMIIVADKIGFPLIANIFALTPHWSIEFIAELGSALLWTIFVFSVMLFVVACFIRVGLQAFLRVG